MTGMSTKSRSLVVGVRLLLALFLLGAGSSVLVAQEVGVVTNYAVNSFTVFDRATGATLAVVPTGTGSRPLGLAITPDGRTLLVANVGTNEVAFYDLRTMPPALLGRVPTGSPCPVGGVTISSDGRFAITSHIWCAPQLTLTSIDIASRSILNQLGGLSGYAVFDLVLTRDNRVALLMGYGYASTVGVSPDGLLIGPQQYGIGSPGTVMNTMAIAPNGRLALAANIWAGSAAVFTIDESDAVHYTWSIPTGSQPSGLAFAPDGSKVYVVNSGASNIAVLSIDSNNLVSDTGVRIAIPGPPSLQIGIQGIAITPDSRLAYVPNVANGTVSVVDLQTNTVVGTIPVGSTPTEIALTTVSSPPVAVCRDVTVPAGPDGTAAASVDGGSNDPNGGPVTLSQAPPGPYAFGSTQVTLTVANNRGDTAECTGTVTVVDTTPPTLLATADPPELWPPDGKLRPVTISGLASDSGSGIAVTTGSFKVTDEYGLVQPQGTFTLSASGAYSFTVALEASRTGTDMDGRRYAVAVTVHDLAGNSTTMTVGVVVPHDQRK